MCNNMLYPAILKLMTKHVREPPGFDPTDEATLGDIFHDTSGGFEEFKANLVDLDIATDANPVSHETTIEELKALIMASSIRHLAAFNQTTSGIVAENAKKIRAAFERARRI